MNVDLAAFGFAIVFAGIISVHREVASFWSPHPLALLLPAVLMGWMPRRVSAPSVGDLARSLVASVPITVAYYVWSVGPVRTSTIPLRSLILLAVVAVLTAVLFVAEWKDGLRYQGLSQTVALAVINLVLVVALSLILILHSRSHSYALSLGFHVVLFLWLSWCAMPCLGLLEWE